MATIPESHQDLLRDNVRAFCSLATLMKDGSPQVTPVWFSWDGEDILINTAVGRQKDRNLKARPQVALVIIDPNNPYRWLQIRGKVVASTTEGAREHINFLNNKYQGNPNYPVVPNQVRIIFRIKPEHVSASH